jgi:hypothetical protein
LSGVAQPGVVDGAQNVVLLHWADFEARWERWIGKVACELGLDFEAGYGGCLGGWLVRGCMRLPAGLSGQVSRPFKASRGSERCACNTYHCLIVRPADWRLIEKNYTLVQ